jgi:hypothetical protein
LQEENIRVFDDNNKKTGAGGITSISPKGGKGINEQSEKRQKGKTKKK